MEVGKGCGGHAKKGQDSVLQKRRKFGNFKALHSRPEHQRY